MEGERWREKEGAKESVGDKEGGTGESKESKLVTRRQHLNTSAIDLCRSKKTSMMARRPRLLGVLVVQSIQILSRCASVSIIPFFLSWCALLSYLGLTPSKQPINTSKTCKVPWLTWSDVPVRESSAAMERSSASWQM